MNKKIEYAFGAILLIGVIFVILGFLLLIITLITDNNLWRTILWEWYEIECQMSSITYTMFRIWFYILIIGIIISLAGNCISFIRIYFKKKS